MADPGGRESGEAGYRLQGDRQDLKAKKRLVSGCQASGCRPLALVTLTHTQLLQQAVVLRLRLQQLQQVSGLHSLQLHLPVHVDLLIESDVHQAGAVATLSARVLAWETGQEETGQGLVLVSGGGQEQDISHLILVTLWNRDSCANAKG